MEELTIEALQDIIKGFADDGKVFSNESQFQFELAWAIAKKSNCFKVNFEYLFELSESKKKAYIDLTIENENKKVYAIELKYKTPDKECVYKCNNKKTHTFAQGAEDCGCYDYLKDVERLEALVNKEKDVEKGFAIILTNSSKYYVHPKPNHTYYWENFFLKNEKTIERKLYWKDPRIEPEGENVICEENDGKVLWKYVKDKKPCDNNHPGFSCTKERYKEIELKNEYKIVWEKYALKTEKSPKSPEFKYLILEINKSIKGK